MIENLNIGSGNEILLYEGLHYAKPTVVMADMGLAINGPCQSVSEDLNGSSDYTKPVEEFYIWRNGIQFVPHSKQEDSFRDFIRETFCRL